jgi:hypothetical protein
MSSKKRKPAEDKIESPAVVTADHVRNRALRTGSKKGWSRLAGYEKAYNRGGLVCRENCTSAPAAEEEKARAYDRFVAARDMDLGLHRCQTPFAPGSDFERVRGSGGAGTPGAFADHARDTKDFWRRVEAGMGANDWMICRMVCVEGYSIAQAVTSVSPIYKCVSLARFREALDALVAAMRLARSPQSGMD